MNEITVHGNITATPVLRYGQNGDGIALCTFAASSRVRPGLSVVTSGG